MDRGQQSWARRGPLDCALLCFRRLDGSRSQTDARAPAILVNELDPGGLQGSAYHVKGGSPRLVHTRLKLANRYYPHTGLFCQI
jgi:hypothetical protein